MPLLATELSPAHTAHPAIQHLRQLHRQLDDEQLLAIAHEALHPPAQPANHSSSSPTPAAFPPLSVIACPGGGKTLTLAARLAFFISHHRIPAARLLAITFTRKAKDELKERVARTLQHEREAALRDGRPPPPSPDGLQVCTFSALALRYVRRYWRKFGWRASLSVVRSDRETKRILAQIVEEAQAAAQQRSKAPLPPAPAEEHKARDEAEEESDEEGGEERWWDEELDEAEMLRLLDDAEAQQFGNSAPSASLAPPQQPPNTPALPLLASQLLHKPLHQQGVKNLVKRAFDYIDRTRLRVGLVLKPQSASSPAYLYTPHGYGGCDGVRLSEDDDAIMHELLRAYDARLHANAQLSRGDFIPALLALLRADEAALREVQAEWRAVFVDEVQDSSRSDIALMLALVGCERWKDVERSGQGARLRPLVAKPAAQQRGLTSHLCVVGDPQQCIYGFRGVDPLALQTMSAALSPHGLVRLRLSTNYRSTQHIVGAAVAIIASNGVKRDEQRKRPHDEVEKGGDGQESNQPPPKQQALAKPAVALPPARAPPIRPSITDGVGQTCALPGLKRPPVKSSSVPSPRAAPLPAPPPAPNPSAAMRTTNEAGQRIVEVRTDGWRQQIHSIAQLVRTLTTGSRAGGWLAQLNCRHSDIAVLVRTNHAAFSIRRGLREARIPVARLAREDADTSSQEDGSTQPRERWDDGAADGVHVLTVHKAKGLEWPVVFVAAFCEGSMPLAGPNAAAVPTSSVEAIAQGGEAAVEADFDAEASAAVHDSEECRVAYVAVTRARKLLFLCHSREDERFNRQFPSRYLALIPPEQRRVQDECAKPVEVASDGPRSRANNVLLAALGPSAAATFVSASRAGRAAQARSAAVSSGWKTAAAMRRPLPSGGAASRKDAHGWTTASRMAGSAQGDVEEGEGGGFQRASTLRVVAAKEEEGLQLKRE